MNLKAMSRTQKFLLSGAALTTAAGLAGIGTYANWTQSQTAAQSVTTGTFGIALGGTGLVNNLPVTVTGVAPGDTIARAVDVTNTGNTDFKTVTLTDPATGMTAPGLSDGTANALTVAVYSCANAWSSTNPVTGCVSPSTVQATEAMTGAESIALTALTGGSTQHLLVVTGYPTAASNFASYGGLSDTITYTFSAVQRDGVSK